MNATTLQKLVSERLDRTPVWVTIITFFMGLGWMRAATEKILDGTWWTGEYLTDFIDDNEDVGLGLFHGFLDLAIEPNVVIVSLIILLMQLGIGTALLAGRATKTALSAGMFLNLNFIAAGAIDPSVFYLLAQGAVLLWLAERSGHRNTVENLEIAGFSGLALAAVAAPSVTTLDPAEVIHDPALMLVTVGVMTAMGAWLTKRRRNLLAEQPSQLVIDRSALATTANRQLTDVN